MPRLVSGLEQIFTDLGIVGEGYKLFFFETTTTTPKTTYSDVDLTVPNPNPIECDAAGRPEYDIWGSDPTTYKMILATPDSVIGNINPIVTVDPIDSLDIGNIISLDPLPAAYWGTTAGTSSNYTLEALVPISSYSNKQCFFVDFHIACVASPDIDINEIGVINLKKYTGSGTKTDLEAGDVQTQRYIAIIDGTDCVILNPEKPYLDSRNLSQSTTAIRGVSYLSSQVTIANNGSDANNDIDFSAGVFQFSDGSGQAVATAQTKRLDVSWAAGTNQGGLFSGSKANSTWYHCFAIYNPTTQTSDFGFDTSVTAANIPNGYTKYKRVGSILTDGSGNIRAFINTAQYFLFTTPILDIDTSTLGTTRTSYTISTPLGVRTIALTNVWRGTDDNIYISQPNTTDLAPSTTASPLSTIFNIVGVSPDSTGFGGFQVMTNTSSQISARASAASAQLRLVTYGYIDLTL